MLPPADRIIGADLDRLLENQLYWVLHAPRQTGKTTFLMSWMREINSKADAIACYVSVETAQGIPETERAMPNICKAVESFARNAGFESPKFDSAVPESMLKEQLETWAVMVAPKPLIVLFDEVDVLEGPTMISFLRQLRSGFAGRGVGKFPVSIALVGMRDLRDYLTKSKDGIPVNPGSPFNIKQSSAHISVFDYESVVKLISQHEEDKGQKFSREALDRIWYWSYGQPWVINALCQQCVWSIVPEETRETVEAHHVDEAKERLIVSRATHIDSLAERLREERVRAVVEPILVGEVDHEMAGTRGFELCLDLGLIRLEKGSPVIANRIYQEVIPRYLNYGMQVAIPSPEWEWETGNGKLDMDALIGEFQQFWSWHSEEWGATQDYKAAFPHLFLMAFLQRVVNGGGAIEREYAAGRGRVDIVVKYGGESHLIEIKTVSPKKGRDFALQEGLKQIARYGDRMGVGQKFLVLFDLRPEQLQKTWEERLGNEMAETPSGSVKVFWC